MSRTLPSLNALHAFNAAARLESATRAATELHVTHGAVSRQIRALEDTLGVALFSRQGRGLVLTAAGRRLRDATSAAFDQLRDACAKLRSDGAAAPMVLGCSGSTLARWMIPRLQRLQHDLPGLTVSLSVLDDVPNAGLPGFDAALLIGAPTRPSGWEVHKLAPELITPVFSPRHPHAAALREASVRALEKETLLHTSSRPQAWSDWGRAQRISTGKLHLGQSFEHLYYMLEAAVAGLGVAIAPQQLVADDIASGRLHAPWKFRATGASWVLCASKGANDPRVARLADWLRLELAAT